MVTPGILVPPFKVRVYGACRICAVSALVKCGKTAFVRDGAPESAVISAVDEDASTVH